MCVFSSKTELSGKRERVRGSLSWMRPSLFDDTVLIAYLSGSTVFFRVQKPVIGHSWTPDHYRFTYSNLLLGGDRLGPPLTSGVTMEGTNVGTLRDSVSVTGSEWTQGVHSITSKQQTSTIKKIPFCVIIWFSIKLRR